MLLNTFKNGNLDGQEKQCAQDVTHRWPFGILFQREPSLKLVVWSLVMGNHDLIDFERAAIKPRLTDMLHGVQGVDV